VVGRCTAETPAGVEDSESDTDEGSDLGLEQVEPPSTKRPKGRPRTKRCRQEMSEAPSP
jgi:hypothetical protein